MSELDERIKKLRSTRADYQDEAAWHKFLLDAAYGTGGFRGRVGATAISHLGWAAEAYAQVTSLTSTNNKVIAARDTYLDQFAREDNEKFSRRIDVSHYTNYVGPIHDLLLAYVNKQEMTRDQVPEALQDWLQDVDGKGNSWDVLQRDTIRPRASLLGWCPALLDTVGEPVEGEVSRAREKDLGRRLRVIPLYPLNVLDWIEDEDGDIIAVKLRVDGVVRDDLLSKPVKEERYALWYRDRVERFVVRTEENRPSVIREESVVEHGFGRVPVVVFRAKATPDDKVRGVSTIANSAVTARRLFNLESEMDDHIRGQVFAVMGVPVQDTQSDIGEIIAGNGSALKVPMLAHMGIHFAAPPASVAASLEKRMEVMVREIYRTENVEHAKATGTQATSGVARAYEFEQTNRRLSGIAGSFGRDEQEALRLAGTIQSIAGSDKATVTPPTDFSVEDLAAEIQAALDALGLELGPTAEREMRRRLINRMLPNLPQKVQDEIDAELDEIRTQQTADRALEREVRAESLTSGAEGGQGAGTGAVGGQNGQDDPNADQPMVT